VALQPLTELASGDAQDIATNGPVLDLAVSRDGSQVAFTTQRTTFPFGSPAYVSAPAAVPGLSELFDVDLANSTLTRVTHGFEGGAGAHPHEESSAADPYSSENDGALSPSFSADGNVLAFASTASNLVYGDGNAPLSAETRGSFDGSDAFVVSRTLFGATPVPQYAPVSIPDVSTVPAWMLGVTARAQRDGSVLLRAEVPGPGMLRARAGATVITAISTAGHSSGRTRRGARRRRLSVATRTVATRAHTTVGAGVTALTLTLANRYRGLANGGLSATVEVTFASAGRATLHKSIAVTFQRVGEPKRRAKRKPARHSRTPRVAGHGKAGSR
jgi:hypothetical protein